MSRGNNFIYINGAKFKELIESASGKTLKEISLENGFSDSFLRMVVKAGKASPTAQAVAKLYGIEPSAYEVKAITSQEPATQADDAKQLSFDDLVSADLRDALKALVKEAVKDAIVEAFNGAVISPAPSPATAYLKNLSSKSAGDPDRFEI